MHTATSTHTMETIENHNAALKTTTIRKDALANKPLQGTDTGSSDAPQWSMRHGAGQSDSISDINEKEDKGSLRDMNQAQ